MNSLLVWLDLQRLASLLTPPPSPMWCLPMLVCVGPSPCVLLCSRSVVTFKTSLGHSTLPVGSVVKYICHPTDCVPRLPVCDYHLSI